MKSLFHIEKQYAEIASELLENGGEATPDLEIGLQIVQDELQVKAANYGFIIKELISECNVIDAEIERLKSLKKAREKSAEYLKERISGAMQQFGILKVETPLIKLSFCKGEAVEILDADILTSKFITTKVTHTPNKVAIKDAIKSGEFVEGAILQENNSLQIK